MNLELLSQDTSESRRKALCIPLASSWDYDMKLKDLLRQPNSGLIRQEAGRPIHNLMQGSPNGRSPVSASGGENLSAGNFLLLLFLGLRLDRHSWPNFLEVTDNNLVALANPFVYGYEVAVRCSFLREI